MYAIETINLTKRFNLKRGFFSALKKPLKRRQITALENVDIKVNKGELFGILGLNGAGKTTLMKILATLVLPSSGTAYVNGHDIESEDHLIRGSIGLINNNDRSFYWRLSGRENLEFFGALSGLGSDDKGERIDYLLKLLELDEIAENRFDTYSAGMRHRMSIARGLLNDPPHYSLMSQA